MSLLIKIFNIWEVRMFLFKIYIEIKTWWFDQPTNGISYVRIKANIKNIPERLRVFVPMFTE